MWTIIVGNCVKTAGDVTSTADSNDKLPSKGIKLIQREKNLWAELLPFQSQTTHHPGLGEIWTMLCRTGSIKGMLAVSCVGYDCASTCFSLHNFQ